MAHFYAICSIFSYAGFLAVDCGWADDIDSAGYAAGLLPTALIFGRLFTAILWGVAYDRYGSRWVLIVSMLSVLVGNLVFGVSTSLPAALAVRMLFLGAGDGFTTIMGPIFEEIGGPKQARVTALCNSFGGVINLLAPAISGFTYGTLSAQFPALAPSLIGAAVSFVSLFACFVLPSRRGKSSPRRGGSKGGIRACRLVFACSPILRAVALRAGGGMLIFGIFDVVPLWAVASLEAGGLGLPKDILGVMLAGSAVLQVVFAMAFVGPFVERLGPRKSITWGSGSCAVALLILPFVRFIAVSHETLTIVSASMLHALLVMSMVLSMTACLTANTNMFAYHPQIKGNLNGIVAMIEAIGKLLGPAIFAPLLAYLIGAFPLIYDNAVTSHVVTLRDIFCSGAFFSFFILAIIAFVLTFASLGLPPETDRAPQQDTSTLDLTELPSSVKPEQKGSHDEDDCER